MSVWFALLGTKFGRVSKSRTKPPCSPHPELAVAVAEEALVAEEFDTASELDGTLYGDKEALDMNVLEELPPELGLILAPALLEVVLTVELMIGLLLLDGADGVIVAATTELVVFDDGESCELFVDGVLLVDGPGVVGAADNDPGLVSMPGISDNTLEMAESTGLE